MVNCQDDLDFTVVCCPSPMPIQLLGVTRARTTRYGQRCFAVSGTTLWNSLPLSVCDPSPTLTQFCARLKTVLFGRAYETLACCLCDSLGCKNGCKNTNSLTYLLTYCMHTTQEAEEAHPTAQEVSTHEEQL